MKALIFPNRRNGKPMAMIAGRPAFVHRDSEMLAMNTENDVMICGALYHRDEYQNLTQNVKAFLIRAITAKDSPITFDGFETSGSMCSTISYGYIKDTIIRINLTPGRSCVYAADNTNPTWAKKRYHLKPGSGWATQPPGKPFMRLEGVDDPNLIEGICVPTWTDL